MGFYKWLYPGLRVKRWVLLCSLGVVLCSMGFVLTLIEHQENFGSLFVVLGIIAVILSVRKIMKSVIMFLAPHHEGQVLNIMYQRGVLSSGSRIVAIGGGTGLSTLLRGLKERTSNITAIVTVADDGGSSGRIRDQFDVLPPGDIRNCLAALSDAEPTMQALLQYRFLEGGTELAGHSLGNLLILALTKITGDFEKAILETSRILNIRGRVIPSTLAKVTLEARHEDGVVRAGETNIASSPSPVDRIYLKPADSEAAADAISAIRSADAIVMGPGSLYTSILPNLLIRSLAEAIAFAQVPKIYVCNVMTQPRETSHLESDFAHVSALVKNSRSDILSHCIVNTGAIPEDLVQRYVRESSRPLERESQRIRDLGYEVIEADVVQCVDFVRHNPRKLSKIIMEIAQKR